MQRSSPLLSALLLLPLVPACFTEGDDTTDPPLTDPATDPSPDEDLVSREGETGRLRVTTPDGPMTITYVVQGGHAIHEGDVDLGPVSELKRYRGGAAKLGDRWPNSNVYFRFDDDFTGVTCGAAKTNCVSSRQKVRDTLAAMELKLPLNFIEDTGETADNYITFDWGPDDANYSGVSDSIGMDGGEQTIKFKSGHLADDLNPHWFEAYNLGPNTGTIRHEVLHAVGLWHEQSRPDRDSFIDIFDACIEDDSEDQYETKSGATPVGPYDFSSIMHYGTTAFCEEWPPEFGVDPDGDGCICKTMSSKISGGVIGSGPRPAGFSIEDTNTVYRLYARSYGSNTAADHYGKAVAIGDFDGDGYDDLAVGVPDEERFLINFPNITTISNAGTVMLYKGTSNGPVEWTLLSEASYSGDYTANARFGTSLAVLDLDADGLDDLAIGAPGAEGGAGAVYTFLGTKTEKPFPHRMLTQGFIGQSDEAGDRFGETLAAGPITGLTRTDSCNTSFNGNRYDTLVVGAPGDRNAGLFGTSSRGGAVYLFHEFVPSCSSAVVAAATRLGHGFAHAATTGDDFGVALAVGDLDLDGKADLAVGAPHKGTEAGAVYTYKGKLPPETSPLFWSAMAEGVGTANGSDNMQFGAAVAIGNVFSTTSGNELVIGAPLSLTTGRVFVMSGGLNPVNSKTIDDAFPEAGDRFGAALAVGNVDRTDSNTDLVIGAPGENSNAGAITIYRGGPLTTHVTLRQTDMSPLYDSDAGDLFGSSFAIGNLDGKGAIPSTASAGTLLLDLAIGAPGEAPDVLIGADGPAGSGMVSLMRGTSSGVAATWKQFSQGLTGKL